MQDFKLSGAAMNLLLKDLKNVQEKVESAYAHMEEVVSAVENDENWDGEAQKAFLAYMKLMREYHKCFTDKAEDNPLQQAIDSLENLGDKVEDFYNQFQEYKDMEGMR